MQGAEPFNLVLLIPTLPGELIRRGLLPAELIDGYADYLRPCHGIEVAAQPSSRSCIHFGISRWPCSTRQTSM